MKETRLKILVICICAASLITAGVLLLLHFNRFEITLTVHGEASYTVEYGAAFEAPEAEASCRATLLPFRRELEVTVDDPYRADVLGTYTIRYSAEYKNVREEKEVQVLLRDSEAPVITLAHDPAQMNPAGKPYREEGYSASDNYDGDLTERVLREERDGTVYYSVEDSSGNRTEVSRVVAFTDLPPVLLLAGEPELTIEVFTPYEDAGCTAEDDVDGDLTEQIRCSGLPDGMTVGDFVISYRVGDSAGQETEVQRTVYVRDSEAPVITLKTGIEFLPPGTHYEEEGYSASDNYDGDLSAQVEREEYDDHIVYRVSDSSGNTTEVTREIIYKDVVPPTITLAGNAKIYLPLGTAFTEPGCSAHDDVDGDISDRLDIENTVDPNTPGVYSVYYRIADSAGNAASARREVYVYRPQPSGGAEPGSRIVYLTFDDGPGPYTARLLDILDQYNVKATFFVTNQFPQYRYMIGEIARRGHTVAIHTLSHNYAQVYASEEAFWSDINQMNDIVAAETGQRSNLLRFPGGTSNTVSRHYSVGIMGRLAASAEAMGYRYCDWNVSAEDAVSAHSTAAVAANVIAGIQGQSAAYALQHDIIDYSVEAVSEIIAWGLANGYTFLPITDSTPLTHAAVKN